MYKAAILRLAISRLLEYLPVVILVGIAVFICWQNYQPGTYLSGWDTLHPEFNLKLYTERVFFGAWQEHQGLGAPAAQAHAAELPRLPLLWLLSSILPQSVVRYAFFFLMYIGGAISTYVFIRYTWFKSKKKVLYSWAAMLGGLFYLLNLGTLQQFYVPLEMFAVHFATLGFILWSIERCVSKPSLKNYFLFFIFQILSAPSAHTATLFYVYMVMVGIFTLFLVLTRNRYKLKPSLPHFIVLALLVLAAHFYWIAPNLYYILFHNDYVSLAKISRNFSPEAFWQNQAFGQVWNVIIVKNFLFNWKDYNFATNTFVDLFDEWRSHLTGSFGLVALYFSSVIALVGIPLSSSTVRKSTMLSVLVTAAVAFFFLVNLNPPFTPLYAVLLRSELLHEALRFPFTKFSIVFIFTLSVFLAQTCAYILQYVDKKTFKAKFLVSFVYIACVAGAIVYGNKPALEGSLISPNMKVVYPSAYQELFTWFTTQPREKRIVKLPITTYWGWIYQSWPTASTNQGYQGAGFTWFGIPQPTLDREFDRWVNTNEFFYHELSSAAARKNEAEYLNVLKKYNVSYLLLDASSLNTGQSNLYQDFQDSEKWLEGLPLQRVWQKDFLSVYALRNTEQAHSFIEAPQVYTSVQADTQQVRFDPVYNDVGSYISEPGLLYPFAQLWRESTPNVKYEENHITITSTIQNPKSGAYTLTTPSLERISLPADFLFQDGNLTIDFKIPLTLQTTTSDVWKTSKIDPITIPLTLETSEIIVNLDNNQLKLKNNQTLSTSVSLDLTEPITLQIFDSQVVTTVDGQPSVEADKVISHTLPKIDFIPSVTIPVSLNQGESMQAALEIPAVSLDIPSISINCNPDTIGDTTSATVQNGVQYTATRLGVNCSSTALPLLDQQAYILHLVGENKTGRSIKIYVTDDVSGESIFEELLPEGKFEESYTLLTPATEDFFYRLNLETRSFGQESVNTVEKIELYPLPLEYLSQIKVTPSQQETVFKNEVTLSNKWKVGSYQYGVHVKGIHEQNLVVLSQSYDPAWVAFNTQNPFQVFKHVTYNGWANGWILPQGEHTIIMLYWPQLLIFLGLGFLLITCILFFTFFILQKPSNSKNKKAKVPTSIKVFLKDSFLGK